MPVIPCPNKVLCPSLDGNPLTNYSSEDPDPAIRLGYSTGTARTNFGRGGSAGTGNGGNPPALGSDWDNKSVLEIVEVTDPDVDPDDAAGNALIDLLVDDTTPGAGGWKTPPGQTRPTVYVNHPQTCTIFCPDGSPFSFTVPVGTFRSLTQSGADRAAYSYACRQAQLNAICLSSIASNACISQAYNQTIVANSANIPITFTVVSGTIPSWMTATVGSSSIHLTGTPEIADLGDVFFTIEAVDQFGHTMTKAYTITVGGITTVSDLPTFAQNVPYSKQLTDTIGGTYSLVAGGFPPGLTLSSSGLISGTPTVPAGLYPVIIQVTAGGVTCSATFSFGDACVPLVTPTLDATYVVASGQSVFCNRTGTIFSVNGSDLKTLLEISTSGVVLNAFSISADAISMIFYEDVHQKIYVGYTVGLLNRVASIDPVTRTISNSTTLSGPASPVFATYDNDRDKLWMSDALETIYVLNCTSFSYTALIATVNFVVGPDHFAPNEDLVYISSIGSVVSFGSYFSPAPTAGMALINAATFVPAITNFSTVDSTVGVGYCPDTNRVYAAYSPGNKVYLVNPTSPNLSTFITLSTDVYSAVFNSCTHRMQVLAANAPKVITMHYINPASLTVVSVPVAPVMHQFNPSLIWYDSVNARVWVGTKTALLKFT